MRDGILQRILAILGILAIQNQSNLKCNVERYSDLTPETFKVSFRDFLLKKCFNQNNVLSQNQGKISISKRLSQTDP